MCNFWVGVGNCFAKNKLPGCFKLRRPRDSLFYQRNPIFSHYVSLVAPIPQSLTGGLPALAEGPGPWCWACSPAVAKGWKLEGPLGRGHHPTPCTLAAHHPGVFISIETGLQEAAGHGPNLGAAGRASRSWGVGGSRGSTIAAWFLFPSVFSPKRSITVLETLNGGHFGEDAIFLSCDALSSLDLGHIVPTVHSPPPRPPSPPFWRSSPRPGA